MSGRLCNFLGEGNFNFYLCPSPFEIIGQHKEVTILWASGHVIVQPECLYHTKWQGSPLNRVLCVQLFSHRESRARLSLSVLQTGIFYVGGAVGTLHICLAQTDRQNGVLLIGTSVVKCAQNEHVSS